jgi:hypothetical protein
MRQVPPGFTFDHVNQLTSAQIAGMEKGSFHNVKSQPGLLRATVAANGNSYEISLLDGKLLSGKKVVAITIRPATTQTTRPQAFGPVLDADAGYRQFFICSYGSVASISSDLYVHLCSQDVFWLGVTMFAIIAVIGGLIALALAAGGVAGSAIIGIFVVAILTIGVGIGIAKLLNSDGSMDLDIPWSVWNQTGLGGWFYFGNGKSGYVQGNPCNLYIEGAWRNGCQAGLTTNWVAVNADGRLEPTAIGTGGGGFSIAQVCNPNCPWTGWLSHGGGGLVNHFATGLDPNGEVEILAITSSGGLYENYQNAPGSRTWVGWAYLGCCYQGIPSISENADGRLEAVVRGTNNNIYHFWETTPGGVWNGVANLGCCFRSNPTIIANTDGRLEVFVEDFYNNLMHFWQVCPGCGWSNWSNLGCCVVGDPAVARIDDGSLAVFAKGTDNTSMFYQRQASPGGAFFGWKGLGAKITSTPVIRANNDGRLELFGTGSDNHLWHIWETYPGYGWSSWADLGCCVHGNPDVEENSNGILEAFAVGLDQQLWHKWQSSPGSSTWSGWNSLGGGVLTP